MSGSHKAGEALCSSQGCADDGARGQPVPGGGSPVHGHPPQVGLQQWRRPNLPNFNLELARGDTLLESLGCTAGNGFTRHSLHATDALQGTLLCHLRPMQAGAWG